MPFRHATFTGGDARLQPLRPTPGKPQRLKPFESHALGGIAKAMP